MQLTALNPMKVFIGKKGMEATINRFVYSNFNYFLVLPHANPRTKLKNYTNVV